MIDPQLLFLVISIGLLLVFIGIILLFIGSIKGSGEKSVSTGGVLIIGPIPIIFGSNQKIALAMLVLAVILTVLLFILYLGFLTPFKRWF
ncbi:MAG: hypothetical protein B6U89_01310 [Desulfurococcales archaeon ex4484_58]|nr:MAG: hypothetical protein B6U89_01310 [Desulfurococcales archaeon ex4484_58]